MVVTRKNEKDIANNSEKVRSERIGFIKGKYCNVIRKFR